VNDRTVEIEAIAIQTPQYRQSNFGKTGYSLLGAMISNGLIFRKVFRAA
jgi:hypothetical protein